MVKAENSENIGVTWKKLEQLRKIWSHSENFGDTQKKVETLRKKWPIAWKKFVRSQMVDKSRINLNETYSLARSMKCIHSECKFEVAPCIKVDLHTSERRYVNCCP